MTWYSTLLGKAIRDRLIADTASGGLRAGTGTPLIAASGSIIVGAVPERTEYPYVSINIFGANQSDAMRTRRFYVQVNVRVVTAETSTDYDSYARHGAILERIAGDWPAQAYGTAPTFGLDRWTPSLTGWTNNILTLEEDTQGDTEGVLENILTFRTAVNQVGA